MNGKLPLNSNAGSSLNVKSASAVNDADPRKSSKADVELSKPDLRTITTSSWKICTFTSWSLLLLNHLFQAHLHLQNFALLIHHNLVICQSLYLLEHIREDILLRPGEVTHWVNLMLPKAKLKPLFWDKVLANPEHSMVCLEIKASSFQFNEEMMDSLFGYLPGGQGKDD